MNAADVQLTGRIRMTAILQDLQYQQQEVGGWRPCLAQQRGHGGMVGFSRVSGRIRIRGGEETADSSLWKHNQLIKHIHDQLQS